jgi:hypothetical protein
MNDFVLLFMKIYNSTLFQNMFSNNILCFSLMSQELIAVGIVKLSYKVLISNVTKSQRKLENALVEKIPESFFNFFLLSSCNKVTSY